MSLMAQMIRDFTGTRLVMVVAVDSKQSPGGTEPAGCKGSPAWSPKASGSPVWRFMGRGQPWGRQDQMECCGIPAHLQNSFREHGGVRVPSRPSPGRERMAAQHSRPYAPPGRTPGSSRVLRSRQKLQSAPGLGGGGERWRPCESRVQGPGSR